MKKRFDRWLAVKLGDTLSSVNFFYFCIILDLVELKPVIDAHSVITWVTYLSQSVIQLIALPILGAQAKLTQEGHKDIKKHIDSHMERLHTVIRKNK